MKKDKVLRTVVIFQAICLIVLTGLVVVKMWPLQTENEHDPENSASAGNGHVDRPDPDGNASQAVASINGIPITRGELTAELYSLHGDAVLRQMLVRKAALLEADGKGLSVAQADMDRALLEAAEWYGGVEAYYEAMREQLGMSKEQVAADLGHRLLLEEIAYGEASISDAEVEFFLEQNPEFGKPRNELHLLWILIATRSQAEELLDSLEAGEEFADLAFAYSRDEYTADLGGDLGFVMEDDPFYDAKLLAEAGSLAVGDIAGPVDLEDGGYAIVRLAGRRSMGGVASDMLEEAARRELARKEIGSLADLEEKLLKKYGAVIVK